jgi:ComF family protein
VLRCRACGRRTGPHGSPWGCPACTGAGADHDALRWHGTPAALRRRALHGVVAAWSYTGPPRDLVLALKFRARPEAAGLLAGGLAEALRRARLPGDLVVPVPLSARRRRQRGYDQARRLARPVAQALGLPYAERALRRTRHTAPQSGLPPAARRVGPRGAFAVRPGAVAGRCVILIDDVLTSGATARAAALALRRAGALVVTAAVACRAERRSAP